MQKFLFIIKTYFSILVMNWWHRKNVLTFCLLPLAWVFQLISYLRYTYYRLHVKVRAPVPVIIVGNLSVGGTGKTPLVVFIASFLQSQGFRPAIIMHGYASALKKEEVISVLPTSDVAIVGDEALLVARKCQMKVVVSKKRTLAVAYLAQHFQEIDVIICDDGLQHYQLARDIEIALIDGQRRFGNGFCLPVGPLRENKRRLKRVDFMITNGPAQCGEWSMKTTLSASAFRVSDSNYSCSLQAFVGKEIHAVAGIGHPDRFFKMLHELGIVVIKHRFPDHHLYQSADLDFQDDLPILITEKDAVKCQSFAKNNVWAVPLEISLPTAFLEKLRERIHHGQKTTRHPRLPNMQATPSL